MKNLTILMKTFVINNVNSGKSNVETIYISALSSEEAIEVFNEKKYGNRKNTFGIRELYRCEESKLIQTKNKYFFSVA